MVENFLGPSELHLKKELSALRKSRFLRDPETCISWRSPFSSRSVAAISSFNHGKKSKHNSVSEAISVGSLELHPMRAKRRKKVHLYNWERHSSKSSDSRVRLDAWPASVKGSVVEYPLHDHGKVDYMRNIYFEDPMTIYVTGGLHPGTPRRIANTLRRRAIMKKRMAKNSPKRSNRAPCSSRVLDSYEQSDGSIYSKMFRGDTRGDSSHFNTPVSFRSCTRYASDCDEEVDLELRGHKGCTIPYHWSKRMRDWSCGGCYSPSRSGTPRRKGSNILFGRQTMYQKPRSPDEHQQKFLSHYPQVLSLLTNSCHECSSSEDLASDDRSTHIELELEASSRLDGNRWSSCRSQDGAEISILKGARQPLLNRSLSQKYLPRSFDEIIGHDIVVQSLSNSIARQRIAPAYLFHGPRGTGKSLTARIFAAALNCSSGEENKPCGICRECTDFAVRNGTLMREVNAINKKDIGRVRHLLKNMCAAKTPPSRYKVFVIDECHMVPSKIWSAFMKFLQEPPSHVVFIFITTNPDSLPSTIVSRCRKYPFLRIKDADIVCRLRKLSSEENFDVDLDSLDLIALHSRGSLRDAEMMLDQLGLLGKRITTSVVNDFVGIVSDEKLLLLLEIAMSSDTAEIVKRSREILDSGIDPVVLMSQLAGLIMDIIAGTNQLVNSQYNVTESGMEKLQQALMILSDAVKQLRSSGERSTWFTATLLQLGSCDTLECDHSTKSSIGAKPRKTNEGSCDILKEASSCDNKSHQSLVLKESSSASLPRVNSRRYEFHEFTSPLISENLPTEKSRTDNKYAGKSSMDGAPEVDASSDRDLECVSPERLDEIWKRCIEKCPSNKLKQLLSAHAKLMSITDSEGVLTAFVAFGDRNAKLRAKVFLSSITNALEMVLRHNVEVRIGTLSKTYLKAMDLLSDSPLNNHARIMEILNEVDKDESHQVNGSYDKELGNGSFESFELPRRSIYCSDGLLQKDLGKEGFIPQMHELTTGKQSLKAHKVPLGLSSHSEHEKNQFRQQSSLYGRESSLPLSVSSRLWEDDRMNEIQELTITGTQDRGAENYAISPSLLHRNYFGANFGIENLDHDAGIGQNRIPRWTTNKPPRGPVRQLSRVRSTKGGCLPCFRHSGKAKQDVEMIELSKLKS